MGFLTNMDVLVCFSLLDVERHLIFQKTALVGSRGLLAQTTRRRRKSDLPDATRRLICIRPAMAAGTGKHVRGARPLLVPKWLPARERERSDGDAPRVRFELATAPDRSAANKQTHKRRLACFVWGWRAVPDGRPA